MGGWSRRAAGPWQEVAGEVTGERERARELEEMQVLEYCSTTNLRFCSTLVPLNLTVLFPERGGEGAGSEGGGSDAERGI